MSDDDRDTNEWMKTAGGGMNRNTASTHEGAGAVARQIPTTRTTVAEGVAQAPVRPATTVLMASNAATVEKSFQACCGVGQLDSLTATTRCGRFT